MEKMTIAETISKVKENNLSSIYTKEDVVRMLENVKEGQIANFDDLQEKIKNAIEQKIHNKDNSFFVDIDSAEFSISGREIEIDCIDVNTEDIVSEICNVVDNVFEWVQL